MAVNPNIYHKVNSSIKNIRSRLLNEAFCCLCFAPLVNTEGSVLCDACSGDLPRNRRSCPACAIPVESGGLCADCLQSNNQLITRAMAAFRYEYPVNLLIHEMKFRARLDIAAFFGRRMAETVLYNGLTLPECIIPVPLHYTRTAERGFNQALELARMVASATGIAVEYLTVWRRHKTPPQAGLPAKQRRQNVRGAFAFDGHRRFNYQHVAIVDDVITTGSTMREFAQTLSRAGIKRIDVWACARVSV